VRCAAVMQEILDGPDVTDDEIEVGRGGREEADEQPPAERQRLLIGRLRRGRPRQQRAGKRVRQRVHGFNSSNQLLHLVFRLNVEQQPGVRPPQRQFGFGRGRA